ncbi:hypothetical protein D3C73_888340 [compost metagenome]
MQTRQQLQAVDSEKLFAAPTDQGRALGVEQLAGLGADRQDLPAEAHGQQALPRGFQILPAAVEGQDDFVRITGVEHPAFDLADRHGQQRSAVVGTAEGAFAGQVENAENVALGAMDRHRSAGKITEAIQVMLAAIDQGRPCFHQCRAEGVGAADRFAPAGAEGDVLQAAALETVGAAFDGEDGGVGVGEDDQPFLALTLGQVIDGRQRGVDQQAVAGQQHVEAGTRFQRQLMLGIEMHAMAETASPRGIDFRTQDAIRHFAFQVQLFPSQPGFAMQFGGVCFYWRHQALRVIHPAPSYVGALEQSLR